MAGTHPKLKVGCCGFPTRTARDVGLFPVVEVQMTFYQPPEPMTLERWRNIQNLAARRMQHG